MKKLSNFILIILISVLFAGVYGIIHDQVTYTISPEYFTLLKFPQFGIEQLHWPVRLKVGMIGFLATWWVGLFLGFGYAFVSLLFNPENILKVTLQSLFINIGVTFILGISGYIWSVFLLTQENISWYIPPGTQDIRNFINVGSIHNFGYIGGIAGLIAGIAYLIRKQKPYR
ncbi:MAG: hypothetical protein LBE92_17235 [Chryseobacterium sp.]|jgi:hypothetical protein|uniref:hypothetical protein n=1 Tax=Chryseobacterium sp. TaxID=1871047 RepID=UPI002836096A|nr:hypothetical protein [Chryseobacterium sp.]MDR2237870.1 hypothetical protein [Chryseobacterium sp.]